MLKLPPCSKLQSNSWGGPPPPAITWASAPWDWKIALEQWPTGLRRAGSIRHSSLPKLHVPGWKVKSSRADFLPAPAHIFFPAALAEQSALFLPETKVAAQLVTTKLYCASS